MNKYMECGIYPKVGTRLWCPVCGKYFEASNDTRYIRHGMYVCGWKCFRDPSKEIIEEPREDEVVAVTVKVATKGKINKNNTIVTDIKLPKSAKNAPKNSLTGANNAKPIVDLQKSMKQNEINTKKDEKIMKSTGKMQKSDLF